MKRNLGFMVFLIVIFLSCSTNDQVVKRSDKSLLILGDQETIRGEEGTSFLSSLKSSFDKIDTIYDHTVLSEEKMLEYSVIALVNAAVNEMKPPIHQAFKRYTEGGGGLLTYKLDKLTTHRWPWLQNVVDSDIDLTNLTTRIAALKDDTKFDGIADYLIGNNTFYKNKIMSPVAPESTRFSYEILDQDIYEPMEMVITPDNKVLFIERRGKMKLYDPESNKTTTIAEFDVCIEGNYEDGLLGLAIDPDFSEDKPYIYMYYSPVCDTPYQYLSRFEFDGTSVDVTSEKLILEVFVQRETCCHSGGSVEFGPDGLLWLSTGDNTSSKESDGYSPIDERPGRSPFDAQKSSGNTHDLRGKILRIKIKDDGTYSIPEGNLFAKDGSEGRPEIFVMGARNPFRIAIDSKTNTLFWGDVGPDSGKDDIYGKESFDEWNFADEPGNYGWPLFNGNNLGYPDRDFAADTVGALPDPQRPTNTSPFNTGAEVLPPAIPAWIYYPYGDSPEFPMLGKGSRSAMAGPIYHDQPEYSKFIKFPEYYEDKFFIYEWARSWIKVVTFGENRAVVKIEDFLDDIKISAPIDMEIGPDGSMYMLEYGAQYFSNNPDAKLVKINFNKFNQPPVLKVDSDKDFIAVGENVEFNSSGSRDPDRDSIKYEWSFTDDSSVQATGENVSWKFDKRGKYEVELRGTDEHQAVSSIKKTIYVGNDAPIVDIGINGNNSFYFKGINNTYSIDVRDTEDENGSGLMESNKSFTYSYIEDLDYVKLLMEGKAEVPDGALQFLEGKNLIEKSDCRTCHHDINTSIGPSYSKLANFYEPNEEVVIGLAMKVINGGNGKWGEAVMAAHPQLSEDDAIKMVEYILSLDEEINLPLDGKLAYDKTGGAYILKASYLDQGSDDIPPASTKEVVILRDPFFEAEKVDKRERSYPVDIDEDGEEVAVGIGKGGFLKINKLNLTALSGLHVKLKHGLKGSLEARMGSPDGPLIGSLSINSVSNDYLERFMTFDQSSETDDLYLVGKSEAPGFFVALIDWIKFEAIPKDIN